MDSLPTEIVIYIGDFLDGVSLCLTRLVCKEWAYVLPKRKLILQKVVCTLVETQNVTILEKIWEKIGEYDIYEMAIGREASRLREWLRTYAFPVEKAKYYVWWCLKRKDKAGLRFHLHNIFHDVGHKSYIIAKTVKLMDVEMLDEVCHIFKIPIETSSVAAIIKWGFKETLYCRTGKLVRLIIYKWDEIVDAFEVASGFTEGNFARINKEKVTSIWAYEYLYGNVPLVDSSSDSEMEEDTMEVYDGRIRILDTVWEI